MSEMTSFCPTCGFPFVSVERETDTTPVNTGHMTMHAPGPQHVIVECSKGEVGAYRQTDGGYEFELRCEAI